MLSRPIKFLLLLLPVAALAASEITTDKPIVDFRLPTFTADGYRSWLVRGSEARFAARNQIDIRELTLTIFTGKADGKIDTMMLSPAARVLPDESVVTGPGSIRVINDQYEATGIGWRYEQKTKRVSIDGHVRVTFRAEMKDLLK